jgi:hypothetical protein
VPADHDADLQLVVERRRAGGDGHVVGRADHGRGVGEVEDRQLVPVGVHRPPQRGAGGHDVLLEGHEVPHRRRRGDGGPQAHAALRQDLDRGAQGAVGGIGQRLGGQQVDQPAVGQAVQRAVDDERDVVGPVAG